MAKDPAWSGKLLDANGRVGQIRMDVAEGGGRGAFTLTLQARDGQPSEYRSEAAFVTEGDTVRLRSTIPGEQRGKLEWDASLSRADAARYAKAAMFGTYTVAGSGTDLPLSRGVVILWQFT